MTWWQRLLRTPALYGQTVSYMAAVIVIGLIVDGYIRVAVGIAALGFAAILIVLLAMRRDMREELARVTRDLATVHGLVNHRSDEQMARIDQLTASIIRGDTEVPDDPAKPQTNAAEGETE